MFNMQFYVVRMTRVVKGTDAICGKISKSIFGAVTKLSYILDVLRIVQFSPNVL